MKSHPFSKFELAVPVPELTNELKFSVAATPNEPRLIVPAGTTRSSSRKKLPSRRRRNRSARPRRANQFIRTNATLRKNLANIRASVASDELGVASQGSVVRGQESGVRGQGFSH